MPAALIALLPTLLAALVPVTVDGVRGIFNWFTGGAGAQPSNVQEAIQLMQAETEKLKAIAQLDTPAGSISLWVANLRASFRYIGAAIILLPFPFILGYAAYNPTDPVLTLLQVYSDQLVGPVFGFMYGSRLSLNLKKK